MVDITSLAELSQKEKPNSIEVLLQGVFHADRESIDFKTQLEDRQISALSKLEFLSFHVGMDRTLGQFCDKFKRLMVSQKRQGRNEFIAALKNELVQELMKETERRRAEMLGLQQGINK